MHMLRRFILVLFLICPLMIGGCSQGETETDLLADNDESLIYEETISPNEDYVSSQDDIVYYTIRFYQDEDDKITVTADSNALLFEKMEYEVPADVDNSTGNIEYSGSVTVRGNVKGGFHISAKGDIVVEGIVEDAELYAGGQIIVKRGIHGMGKGVLQAGGNVLCKFIENAKVISGGYVDSEAILHSQVDAYSDVIVDGKKGFITGGIIRAGNLVSAKTIGSAMETITQIEVGADPLEKERYVELQKQIRTYNEQIDRIKPIVTTYSEKLKHGEHLSQEQLTYVRKLAEQLKQLKGAAEPLKAEAAKINGILALGSSARVKVANTIYSGVTIVISDTRMTLKNERTYSQFIRQDGEIKIIPL